MIIHVRRLQNYNEIIIIVITKNNLLSTKQLQIKSAFAARTRQKFT